MNILERVLRVGEGRKIKKLEEQVVQVNAWDGDFQKLSDAELKDKTVEFRQRLEGGETADDLLPEAFATVREASRRSIGLRHFDVQIMGGIVLHEGKIAEMKTGEGKTLVATLPVYLNALVGKGVHVVTVNDYLARRDSEWMAPVYEFLGLTVGVIQAEMHPAERKPAYSCDVTYGTNNEFGFDYLRDNMVTRFEDKVQRGHGYAIVDEVDSILIDEARTPLIISGPAEQFRNVYEKADRVIRSLHGITVAKDDKELEARVDTDYDWVASEKEHTVRTTERGQEKIARAMDIDVERLFGSEDLEAALEGGVRAQDEFFIVQLRKIIEQAIRSHSLYKIDRDYVVKDGEVIIVDEFTGRLMFGRRYSEGLHQAIEAKEHVKPREESQTLATITLQNYFRMYDKLAGMTGTAATEATEFEHIYKLETVVIPTHMPMVRADMADYIYKNEEAKFKAAVEDIVSRCEAGQPLLVGTVSIENSEKLSRMLEKRGVKHEVLNAKNHEREAEIIAQAGRKGAVTIATNMAGRGVDIVLGGNPPDEEGAQEVKDVGGLHVLGTERHEARRIDNQLRGRSGRQGDAGSSQFYLSLEDDLMRLFGSERIGRIMERLGLPDDQPIEHGLISKSIETAQRQVEAHNFEIRKHVLEYDDVMNKQREVIYQERAKVLERQDLHEQVRGFIDEVIPNMVAAFAPDGVIPEEWDLEGLLAQCGQLFPLDWNAGDLDLDHLIQDELCERIIETAQQVYQEREETLGAETMREIERMVMLQVIDNLWRDHLYEMDYLKEGIGLRAIGQRDPLVEYKSEAFDMFQNLIAAIKEDFLRFIFHVQVVEEYTQQPELELVAAGADTPYAGADTGAYSRAGSGAGRPKRHRGKAKGAARSSRAGIGGGDIVGMDAGRDAGGDAGGGGSVQAGVVGGGGGQPRVGRNEPCPCGSGKKYKKCCGA